MSTLQDSESLDKVAVAEDFKLLDAVMKVKQEHPDFGIKRVFKELRDKGGWSVSQQAVKRCMQHHSITSAETGKEATSSKQLNTIMVQETGGNYCLEDIVVEKKDAQKRQFGFSDVLECFKKMVLGDPDVPANFHPQGMKVGQLEHEKFSASVEFLATMFQDGPVDGVTSKEEIVVWRLVEFVGQPNDAKLLSQLRNQFRRSLSDVGGFNLLLPVTSMFQMKTAKSYIRDLGICRGGTIAHLKNQQQLLGCIVGGGTGFPIFMQSSPMSILSYGTTMGDHKVWTKHTIFDELVHAGQGGYVRSMSGSRIEFSEMSHRVYAAWLVNELLPTVKRSDLKGSLGTWHQLKDWERQLTSLLRVNEANVALEVATNYDVSPWIRGFVEQDLDLLLHCPGTDADRRILRFVILCIPAFKASIRARERNKSGTPHVVEAPGQGAPNLSEMDATFETVKAEPGTAGNAVAEGGGTIFCSPSPGTRVVVHGILDSEILVNGMTGVVQDCDSSDTSCLVKFANLGQAQTISRQNLRLAEKAHREKTCGQCGLEGKNRCSACMMAWYCSKKCQKQHWKNHKVGCKVWQSKSKHPNLDLMFPGLSP